MSVALNTIISQGARSGFNYHNSDNGTVANNLVKNLNRQTAVASEVSSVSRMDSAYAKEFSLALNLAAGVLSYDSEVSDALEEILNSFKTTDDSKLNKALSEFINSLPLTEDGVQKVLEDFNKTYESLVNFKNNFIDDSESTGTISHNVTKINELCSKIQRLNSNINKLQNRRRSELQLVEFRQERDKLLNQLCELVNVKVNSDSSNATISLNLQNGSSMPLLDFSNNQNFLSLEQDDNNNLILTAADTENNLQLDSSGKLAGLLDVYSFSKDLLNEFDKFGMQFAEYLNEASDEEAVSFEAASGFALKENKELSFVSEKIDTDKSEAVSNILNSAVAQTQLLSEKFSAKSVDSQAMKNMFEHSSGDLKNIVDSQQAFKAAENSLNTLNNLLENSI